MGLSRRWLYSTLRQSALKLRRKRMVRSSQKPQSLKPLKSLSLFEQRSEPSSSLMEKDSPSPAEEKIKDPCPRCGGRSAPTAHPYDHDGHSRYCAGGCL